jgi:hypothetical protein
MSIGRPAGHSGRDADGQFVKMGWG